MTDREYAHLCDETAVADLPRLRRRVATHVDVIAEAALSRPDLPENLAEQLAERLTQLIGRAVDFAPEGRALVRGAVEYFLLTEDENADVGGPHGLDDDVEVFNDVCARVGCENLRLSL